MNHRYTVLTAGLLALSFSASAQTAKQVYIVQLADAPAATYAGGTGTLAATRPAAGTKLDSAAPNVRAYANHLDIRRSAELARAGIRTAPLHTYSYTYSGFSALLTDAEAKALKQSAGVASVVPSTLMKVDTTRTPGFLGLNAPGGIWSQLDAASRQIKGENVIIGVIDTGVWPETASFGDKMDGAGKPVAYTGAGTLAYGPPPAKWKGVCVTGEGFTAAMCNNKVIGARYYSDNFVAAANASAGGPSPYTLHPTLEYVSPRDGAGHGSHTASTSGGNNGVNATVNGTAVGEISGIAPRARLAVYKVCWTASTTPTHDGCFSADSMKAIDDAVADGVDVINFSISGTLTNFNDPVEIAFLNAAAAGVFVAASAGNSGPANTVAHISPWLMTVAASTHDRQALADFTTGDGAAHRNGVSVYGSTLPAHMVLAEAIPAAGAAVANARRCFAGALDSAGAAGKIVVCDRGVNARVDKSAEVKRAGGVGMVLLNTNPAANGLVADFHSVPSIHLPLAERASIYAYGQTLGAAATGTISPPSAPPAVVAPVMADFSSRGPNLGNLNIMKPDITAPGVDVIAAYIDDSAAQRAQHAATAANTFTPNANAFSLSGTSMSSPHTAGAGALLRQAYPAWSPAAIKSALMTTAQNNVRLADGTPDTDRWGYGAGHLNPNGARLPTLVYDLTAADYGRFLCGQGLTPPAGIGNCATLGSVRPQDLNLASITMGSVVGNQTVTRTVTNVSGATGTFQATVAVPGYSATVAPASLTLANGASGSFTVTVNVTSAPLNTWAFGSLAWTDGVRTVTSPVNARALSISAPSVIADVRPSGGANPAAAGSGTKAVPVVSSYTGSLAVTTVGLVPATRFDSTIQGGATQCFNVTVGAGAQLARFQLFNADTTSSLSVTDLDLDVFNGPDGTGVNVGSSGGGSSDELVMLTDPTPGTYSACVTGFAVGTGATYALSTWVVGPAVGVQTLRASAPRKVYVGGAGTVALAWSVPAGKRYLGKVTFVNNTDPAAPVPLSSSVVFVDNH